MLNKTKTMLNKIKTWIIKKLGGFTSLEFNHVNNELNKVKNDLYITNRLNTIKFENVPIITLKEHVQVPFYAQDYAFDARKHVIQRMSDTIIESGALHVTEFPNPKECCMDMEFILKLVR